MTSERALGLAVATFVVTTVLVVVVFAVLDVRMLFLPGPLVVAAGAAYATYLAARGSRTT